MFACYPVRQAASDRAGDEHGFWMHSSWSVSEVSAAPYGALWWYRSWKLLASRGPAMMMMMMMALTSSRRRGGSSHSARRGASERRSATHCHVCAPGNASKGLLLVSQTLGTVNGHRWSDCTGEESWDRWRGGIPGLKFAGSNGPTRHKHWTTTPREPPPTQHAAARPSQL